MSAHASIDDDLLRKLPLPLAQLYRRAHNAKTERDRHDTAYYLWEAGLKLLASVAIVEYAEQGQRDPKIDERLTMLARPSLGHWWEFARLLVPALAAAEVAGFAQVRELLLGRTRDDLPRVAGLDALLIEDLTGRGGARATVRLTELFDRLVRYRNKEYGHGATGQRPAEFYRRMGSSLLEGVAQVVGRLNVLAGRRLIYLSDVKRLPSGAWQVERDELIGETHQRMEPLVWPNSAAEIPRPGRLYVQFADDESAPLRELHPLVVYDPEQGQVHFLNSRLGERRIEYLCYISGKPAGREQLGREHRELLARVLKLDVDGSATDDWVTRSQAEEPAEAAPEPDPSRRAIGEFELLSEIGEGAMGVVYRAWQPSLGRQVALKCVARTRNAKIEERFSREISLLGRVEHPNLVRVFTAGSHGDQRFYAMELIEGADLSAIWSTLAGSKASDIGHDEWQRAISTACEAARTKQDSQGRQSAELPAEALSDSAGSPVAASGPDEKSPIAPAEAPAVPPAGSPVGTSHVAHTVEIVRQVASAAHALHRAGVIHRDIKPGNVMLTADRSRAVLVDLGLAKLADETEQSLTRTSQFVGTLRYASPEQLLPRFQLDARSDVYALGALMWELLTLRPLYGATDETTALEVMKRIQFDDPHSVRHLNPAVNRDLAAVVHKCLEKNPSHRYASAQELADDLGRWQRGEPVRARRRSIPVTLLRSASRHRQTIGWLLICAAAIAGTFYFLKDGEKKWLQQPIVSDPLAGKTAPEPNSKPGSDPIHSGIVEQSAPAIAIAPPAPVKVAKRRALLVGCTKYDNVEERLHLRGPANDVDLLRETLVRVGFDAADIVTLADKEGDDRRPSRANIEQQCRKLAEGAQADDQCLIYFSGHGIRVPASNATAAPDGLEGGFLPCDAAGFDKNTNTYPGMITSTELSEWLRPAVTNGAWLCILYDAQGGLGGDKAHVGNRLVDSERAVFLLAAQPEEPTIELPLPYEAESEQRVMHGLFTFTLCQAVSQAGRPLTYMELIQRVRDQYINWGRTYPTPWLIGGARHQIVLGDAHANNTQPRFLLTKNFNGPGGRINAGSAVGLTPGTILVVKPLEKAGEHANQTASNLGHIRIIQAGGDGAAVEPCAYAGQSAPDKLPDVARCEPVFVDYGEVRLSIGVSEKTRSGERLTQPQRDEWLGRVRTSLASLNAPATEPKNDRNWTEITADSSQARWLVELDAPECHLLFLTPQAGNDGGKQNPANELGIELQEFEATFPEIVGRLARGQGLVKLAALQNLRQLWHPSQVNVRVELLRFPNSKDLAGEVVGNEGGAVGFRQGQTFAFRATNLGELNVVASLLNVSTQFKIWAQLFANSPPVPSKTGKMQWRPGATIHPVRIDPVPDDDFVIIKPGMTVHSERFALDEPASFDVIIIAALPTSAETSFGFLAQPSLKKTLQDRSGKRIRTESALATPIGKLLRTLLYGEGDNTGLAVDELSDFSMSRLSVRFELLSTEKSPASPVDSPIPAPSQGEKSLPNEKK